MAYATAAELRARLEKTSTSKDVTLTALIAAAENSINRFTNRPDGFEADSSASARVYAGSGKTFQWIDECVEITLVAVKDASTDSSYTSWNAADWIAFYGDPLSPEFQPLVLGKPYNAIMVDPTGDESIFTGGRYSNRWGSGPSYAGRGVPTVQITAKWGYSVSTPADIREACLMQAARWYKRFEGAMSDALASGELGTLLYRQSLDPDVKFILVDGRYIKPAIGRW